MLSSSVRRVALFAHRSTTTHARIVPFHVSPLHVGSVAGLRAGALRTLTNPQRNASTNTAATTKKPAAQTKSATTGGTKSRSTPKRELQETPKKGDTDFNVALRAKLKAKREKEAAKKKEVAARKRLVEREKKLAKATKAKEKKEKEKRKKEAIEAKKPKLIKLPPRRMTAFGVFVQDSKKLLKEVAADWRNLSAEQKQEYTVRARAMSEKRKEEFAAFVETIAPKDIVRYNRRQVESGRSRVRVKFASRGRQLSPFMRYLQEFRLRPDQAGKTPIEVAKAGGEAWRSMAQEEKDQYKPKPAEPVTAQGDAQSL